MEELEKLLRGADVGQLARLLADETREIKIQAAEALGKTGCAQAIVPLLSALGDDEYLVRQAAASALAHIGQPAIPALETTLMGQGGRMAPYALWALGTIGSPAAMDALLRAVVSPRWEIRWSAADALGALGGDRAIDALVSALADRDERVRNAAGLALERVGQPAVEALAAALRSPLPGCRTEARRLLERIGGPSAQQRVRREQLLQRIPVLVLAFGALLVALWLVSFLVW
jgi:HEAT repeat protein